MVYSYYFNFKIDNCRYNLVASSKNSLGFLNLSNFCWDNIFDLLSKFDLSYYLLKYIKVHNN